MTQEDDQAKTINLFYSYSHEDEDLRRKLERHLAALRRGGLIADWHDRKIEAGDNWKNEIDRHLTSADIVLLLVSANFIASDYCWGEEMTKALERHERGEARVIPIILRHCRWKSTKLARLQAVPKDAKPVTSWLDCDEAFDDVVAAIERAASDMRRSVAPAPPLVPEKDHGGRALLHPSCSSAAYPTREMEHTLLKGSRHTGVDSKTLPDFAAFRDIDTPWCPEMVVLPAGKFWMGSSSVDKDADDSEKPRHQVSIGYRFAIGRHVVTFAEFDQFCEETGWRKPDDAGWGRDHQPVINVNWGDAKAYAEWLSTETGKPYRLPTEAEWEYACRAGTTTQYSCSDMMGKKDANFGAKVGKTTEVGSYPANPWGLYDMHGNVWEWLEDAWRRDYQDAPEDGRAWLDDSKGTIELPESLRKRTVLRGGSWSYGPKDLRSASRRWIQPDVRMDDFGFRVARTL